jgi:glutamyl-tRNA synthetase
MDIKEAIMKYALQNALKFNGRANIGAVIGKLVSEDPKLKKDMKAISEEVKKIVAKVNKMKKAEQEKQFEKYKGKIKEKKRKERHGLPELRNAKKGKVIMRFEPSPSGPLHVGHAYVISLNSEYCRIYKGKMLLRIADTNPENIYEPSYGLIQEDAKWVTKNNISKVIIQSDRLGYYYDYAEKLIKAGNAYVCTCTADNFRELSRQGTACPCRSKSPAEHLERWKKMFAEYKPGEAVVRIKTDIKHPNPAMRDWPAIRINDHTHPRKGTEHRVWPLMNFSVAIDDMLLGVTHAIRAKEHMDNEKRQKWVFDYFRKTPPTHLYVGRINFKGLEVSCTKTKAKIQLGEFDSWDDIRLPFLLALRRRGYQPDAFVKYAVAVGVSETDKTVSGDEFFKSLNAYNKEVLEPMANRYFFVPNPKEIKIEKALPQQVVQIELHPDFPKRGKRKFVTAEKFYIMEDDYRSLKTGKLYRLMDSLNFRKRGSKLVYDSWEYEHYKEKGEMIMHWLPVQDDLARIELLMPDKTIQKGLGEPLIRKLKPGAVVQFERIGFCRLDRIENNIFKFWFAHR